MLINKVNMLTSLTEKLGFYEIAREVLEQDRSWPDGMHNAKSALHLFQI